MRALLLLGLYWLVLPLLAAEKLSFETVLLLQTEEKQLQERAWLEAWLAATDPALLRKMKRHGRDQWTAKMLKDLSQSLKKRRKHIVREGLELETQQTIQGYGDGGARLSIAFNRYLLNFTGKGSNNRFFSRNIRVLLLNPQDELRLIPFDSREAWEEWMRIREIEHGKRRAHTVHVRYNLKPGRMVQPGLLEMVIAGYAAEVEVYVGRKKVHEDTIRVNLENLRRLNPLSEGVIERLVPIHSLMIDGMSLGEPMPRFQAGACQEQTALMGERLFICRQRDARTGRLQVEYVYLGGKMVRMRHYREVGAEQVGAFDSTLDRTRRPVDRKRSFQLELVRWARRYLGYPHQNWRSSRWSKGRSLLRSIDLPREPDPEWLYFEATHGKVPEWLGEVYPRLP